MEESQPWYVQAFQSDYLDVYAHRDQDNAQAMLEFCIQACDLKPHERILDLCCGQGRHTKILYSQGFQVTGLDLSSELLKHARKTGLKTPLVRADILYIPLADQTFDVIFNLFSSFGYFAQDSENLAALQDATRILKNGGKLLIDHMNPVIVEKKLVAFSEEKKAGKHLSYQRTINKDTQRVEKTVKILSPGQRTTSYKESVRLFLPFEFDRMFEQSGLRLLARYGNFDGSDFLLEESPRQIMLVEKV